MSDKRDCFTQLVSIAVNGQAGRGKRHHQAPVLTFSQQATLQRLVDTDIIQLRKYWQLQSNTAEEKKGVFTVKREDLTAVFIHFPPVLTSLLTCVNAHGAKLCQTPLTYDT